MKFQCPRCSSAIEGEPGAELSCPQCGFKAVVPAQPPAEPRKESSPAEGPPPAAPDPATWGYLVSILALGTFFLAPYGVPFLLGFAGIGLGFWSHVRSRADRRGMVAVVVGIAALLAGGIFLAIP